MHRKLLCSATVVEIPGCQTTANFVMFEGNGQSILVKRLQWSLVC